MKNTHDGMIENLSMVDYRIDPAYSASDIIGIGKSPAQWKFRQSQPREKTRAMELGSATHLMLQAEITGAHDLVAKGVAVYGEGSFRTKGFEKFAAENPRAHCLDTDEHELACRMIQAIMREPEALHYLHGSIAEPSFFVTDPEFGFRRKCRPDFLHVKQGVSINVKTTSDITEKGFFRSIADYGYDLQTVNYQDILMLHFDRSFDEIHIIVEKAAEGPCRVAIRGIDDDTLDQARFQVRRVFERIQACDKSGKWADEPTKLFVSSVPLWARTVIE